MPAMVISRAFWTALEIVGCRARRRESSKCRPGPQTSGVHNVAEKEQVAALKGRNANSVSGAVATAGGMAGLVRGGTTTTRSSPP